MLLKHTRRAYITANSHALRVKEVCRLSHLLLTRHYRGAGRTRHMEHGMLHAYVVHVRRDVWTGDCRKRERGQERGRERRENAGNEGDAYDFRMSDPEASVM